MGFFRQEYWSGLPFPPPADLPDPEIEPSSPLSPALQADSLPAEPSGKSLLITKCIESYPDLGQTNARERGLGAPSHWWGSQEILRVFEEIRHPQACPFVHPTIWTL